MTVPRERYFKEGVVNYARCCQKVADLAINVSEVKEEVFPGNICQHLLLAQLSSRSRVTADSGHGFSVLQALETQLMYSEFNSSSFHKACLPLLGSLVMKARSPHPPAAPSHLVSYQICQFCLQLVSILPSLSLLP